MKGEMLKLHFKQCFYDVFGAEAFDERIIEKYFSKDYVQKVNGEELDYHSFIDHIKVLNDTMATVNLNFEYLVVEGSKLCSVHTVDYVKKDGRSGKARVIGYFEYDDDKLIHCDEYTHRLEGDKADADLGARR